MCPEKTSINIHSSLQRQRGFLMPVALFIIVIMSVYALVLWRTTSQANLSAVQEVVSVQTFYAAESGLQRGMAELFFPDASSRQAADSRCQAMDITLSYTAQGLEHCQARVACDCVYDDARACNPGDAGNYGSTALVAYSFYTLTSNGSCEVGSIRAQRTLEAQATMEQEGL